MPRVLGGSKGGGGGFTWVRYPCTVRILPRVYSTAIFRPREHVRTTGLVKINSERTDREEQDVRVYGVERKWTQMTLCPWHTQVPWSARDLVDGKSR